MDIEDQIPLRLPLQKGGIPLFGRQPIGPLARRAKRGQGRFSQRQVFSIMMKSQKVEKA